MRMAGKKRKLEEWDVSEVKVFIQATAQTLSGM